MRVKRNNPGPAAVMYILFISHTVCAKQNKVYILFSVAGFS